MVARIELRHSLPWQCKGKPRLPVLSTLQKLEMTLRFLIRTTLCTTLKHGTVNEGGRKARLVCLERDFVGTIFTEECCQWAFSFSSSTHCFYSLCRSVAVRLFLECPLFVSLVFAARAGTEMTHRRRRRVPVGRAATAMIAAARDRAVGRAPVPALCIWNCLALSMSYYMRHNQLVTPIIGWNRSPRH